MNKYRTKKLERRITQALNYQLGKVGSCSVVPHDVLYDFYSVTYIFKSKERISFKYCLNRNKHSNRRTIKEFIAYISLVVKSAESTLGKVVKEEKRFVL